MAFYVTDGVVMLCLAY